MMIRPRSQARGYAPATAAYVWYPALDKNSIPWHVGAGAWGSQYSLYECQAPNTLSEVSVTTASDFKTQCELGARIIRIETGTNINCSGVGAIGPVLADLDIIIESGAVLRNVIFGAFDGTQLMDRIRIRGETVGLYSGGQAHNIDFNGRDNVDSMNDIILDGIGLTGSQVVTGQTNALKLQGAGKGFAMQFCKAMAGGEVYIGGVRDWVICGNSCYSAADMPNPPPGDDESWAFRMTRQSSAGGGVLYQNDIRANESRTTVYHRWRIHPGAEGQGHAWICDNTFVDRAEGRILWCVANADSLAHGWLESFITKNNRIYTGDQAVTGQSYYSESALYVEHDGNQFFSSVAVDDADLVVAAEINIDDADGPPPGLTPTVVKTGNVSHGDTADPAWAGQGDPTGLNWEIGES